MLKFTEQPKTPGMTSKKTVLSLKRTSSFAGDFVLIWMKQRLIWFNLQRDGTRIGLTFTGNLQLKMSVLCSKVWPFSKACLSRLEKPALENGHTLVQRTDLLWLGKINIKKKYLVCQIPIKMLKQHATPNSSLHNLKIYSSKRCRKTSQRWIYITS